MAIVPTQKTYGLLVAGGAIATLLTNFSNAPDRLTAALVALLLFDGAVLAAMFWDGWRTRVRRVSVHREPLHRLSIGRDNPISISWEGQHRSTRLRLYDNYPMEFDGTSMPLDITCSGAGTGTVTYTVNPGQRGEYDWGDIQMQQQGPLGLAWADWTVPAAAKVAVYPDLMGLNQLSIKLALQSTGTLRQKRTGVGTEFAELREYGVGDDPRFIDWKATARLSQPLVRVLQPEREQPLIILLDRGRLMTAQVQRLTRFDWGLNAALSLALAGISRGDRVGIGVFDRTLHAWLPPRGGRATLQQMIERLTPIQPVLQESDYLTAATYAAQQQHRRSLIVMITDIVDQTASAELLSAMARMRPRHLPFCITLRDSHIDHQAQQATTELDATYQRAVALDLLNQRKVAFSQLKQRGVLVLDAPAHQISEPLVDAYLRIKTQGKL